MGMREELLESKLEMFGKNEMSIPPPRFLDLFKSQLLAPIAQFQVVVVVVVVVGGGVVCCAGLTLPCRVLTTNRSSRSLRSCSVRFCGC